MHKYWIIEIKGDACVLAILCDNAGIVLEVKLHMEGLFGCDWIIKCSKSHGEQSRHQTYDKAVAIGKLKSKSCANNFLDCNCWEDAV